MAMALTQHTRIIAIYTPLEEDYLLLRSFTGHEGISHLFSFDLDLLSQDPAVKFKDIIGKPVTIRVTLANDKERYFNGFISRFEQIGCDTGLTTYRATMVPWLWFLTQTTDCRIFQNKSVPDIIQQIFKEYGFTDVKFKLEGTYDAREYCVQYRETDYNFVARLMEQYGMFYFFEHEKDKHILVVADSPSAHQPCPEKKEAHWQLPGGGVAPEEDVVTSLQMEQQFRPGKYALSDYFFKVPSTSLLSEVTTTINVGGNGAYEIYDFPGEYEKKKDGEALAKLRMEEEEAKHLIITGTSTCRAFTSGYRFDLKEYGRGDMNKAYMLTEVRHKASLGDSYTTGIGGGSEDYSNKFACIPYEIPYRPLRVTPKPSVRGAQTAVVVGKAGEEIWTDKYGRIKVQFHWDREGKFDQDSSCWIRVSQNWAGKQWGAMFLPRIGQEVIVEFLEGDPDQPIITGRVYNAEQMPPYPLPDEQTKSTIISNSSKGGGGFNELRFEDMAGGEEIYLHGEKDWNVDIKRNESETIGSNLSSSAGGNISQSSGANISRTADDNITDKAGKCINTESGNDMSLKAGGSYALHTNLGIHLKAMNFIAALIESGAKEAAEAIKKGAMRAGVAAAAAGGGAAGTAAGGGAGTGAAAGAGLKAAGGQLASGAEATGMQALAALSPGIEAGAKEIQQRSENAAKGMQNLEGPVNNAIAKADAFKQALDKGASPEAIATAFMAMAAAASEAWADAKKIIEGLLPQIPSIVLWAMKDINATALWSMSLQTRVKDIDIEAKNKNINIKAKRDLNVEAATKDLNLKASKKNVSITGKEKVSIKAEDKAFVIEAGKDKLTIKSPKMIMLKVKSSAVCVTENGILVSSKKVKIKGSEGPVEVKGNPVKLN